MSWKKQGGTNRLDATSNVNVNSVVANKFTIKDYFYGDMNVLGNINADGSMKVKGNLLAGYVGAENILANLTLKVLRNATVFGSMAVKNDMYVYKRQILGSIERNNNIVTIFDSSGGNLGITQAKILDVRTGAAELYFDGHIGFGTNNPVATLDITGNIPLTFAVRTDDTSNYSIISRNNEDTGVVAHTDLATTEIQFYKETPIPANNIYGAVPDARIQYIEGGVLAIDASNSVITYSKSVLTTRDSDQIVNNSALTIYDIDNGPFAFDAYNSLNSIKSNAISISGPDDASMSMIHFTNAETNHGISIGGGAYPPNISQRMGTIGYTQSDGTYAPTINIVSSDTNRLFHRATVGINTQRPRTDEYIMDINGPVIISTTTEINVVQNIPYEMDVLKHCGTDHNYIIAVGKPYTVTGDQDTFYTDLYDTITVKPYQQKVYFTRDMGQTWSVSNFNETDIGISPDNAIHAAYAYDASLCFVCTQTGFMYYSVEGGRNWYGIVGIPNDNIHSVFLTDIFVDSHAVYRVFVSGNTTCTWFDMPTYFYLNPEPFDSTSVNHGSFLFPDGICDTADGIYQVMYATGLDSIHIYNIGNYNDTIPPFTSWTNNSGNSYASMSIYSNVAMFVGPGLITYTIDGGTNYVHLSESPGNFLDGKTLNSVFLGDDANTTALISGYDSTGALFIYSRDQFATFNSITVEDLRNFGAPPHMLESNQLYDAFFASPESIMFFDIVETYNNDENRPDLHKRGKTTIYNLYLPHIFTPEGGRSTSDGTAFRVDYGVSQFGGNVVIEKNVEVNGVLTAASANLADTNLDSAYLYGQTSIHDQLDLYGNIVANGILITPIQLSYINDVTQDIQSQLDEKLGKNENANVNGQLTFSGNNIYSGSNTFYDLRVASAGLTTIVSSDISYNITPDQLSYLRDLSSNVQTQLNDKLSLNANGLTLADFSAIKYATSNFQEQLDRISTSPGQAIQYAAMVELVTANTFNVPNRFNQDTTIVGNVIVLNSAATMITVTPNNLSYLSSVTSDIQTQLNTRVSLNNSSGLDISGIISSAAGFTTGLDVSANTVKTQYQILSGTSAVTTASQTLTAAQSGSIVNITSATASTLTLPTPTTSGLCFIIYNSSAANASIVTPAGLFVPYPDASGVTLLPDSTLQVRSNGTNWAVVGGTYDCARISSANFSAGDYSTTGSISGNTNLTIAGKAAIGKSSVSATDTLDVSGNMHVKGNSFVEGQNLTWGNLDVSGAVSISNSVSIGKTSATAGIEFDLSGDAAISGSLGIGRTRNTAYVADISGAIHGTSLVIDNGVIVGSTMTVAGAATFTSNVGIGKTPTSALDVSGAISATTLAASTLTLSGNPSSGYAIDCSGNIRARTITLTDGTISSDTSLSLNVALLNRTPQTFTGDNNFKYINVGGAIKTTGYAVDISGGLSVTGNMVVSPPIPQASLPGNICFKSNNNLFLDGTTTPYLGIGKGSGATQYNVDVSGSMNADGPIYAQKLGINKKGAITTGIDVDISGTASISNTLNIGQKLTVGAPSVVVASATISKRTGGAYDLFWTAATQSNLSIQLSPVFTLIALSARKITYTAYPTSGTYTFTYVFDYQVAVTNHPPITVYPNSAIANGTGYTITFPTTAIQRGTYSVTANLASGMTTGTMYVDISGVGPNLVVNTQSIIVSIASTATTDANALTPSSATNSVPLSINGAAVFNAPTRFAGGVYADTAQTIHFGANAPIMSGTNILPGTIPSTAFATSGVDLNSNQTVSGTKTFMDDLTVSSPSRLLVGTAAVNANRNSVITADISGGIAASKYMTVGTTTLLNMVSKRADNVAFEINNTNVFGVEISSATRTYSINPLNAELFDISNVRLTRAFAVSGYYTFTISYVPSVSTNRFKSNVVLSAVVVSNTTLATLDLSANTTASSTIYLAGGIPNNIRISAPSTVSGLSITQISLKIEYRYDNTTALGYNMAVNGDQAVFGKFVPYFGIDASSVQTINFGANAPTMSGAGIAAATIPSTSIAGTVALLGATQTFTGTNTFQTTSTANTNLIQVNRTTGGGTIFSNNTGYIGFYNGQTTYWSIAPDGTPSFKLNSITDGTLSVNVALLTGLQSFLGLKTFTGGLTVSGGGISATASQAINFGTNTVTAGSLNLGGAKLLYTGNNNLVFTGTGDTPNYNEAVGSFNICLGSQPMGSAKGTPNNNVAMGTGTLYLANSTIGTIALGGSAARNMIGNYNVAIGHDCLNGIQYGTAYDTTTYGSGNTSGTNNVAVGHSAGTVCRQGNNNTFLGCNADINTAGNTFNNSTAIGFNAKITASNQIMLGTANESVYIPSLLNIGSGLLRSSNRNFVFSETNLNRGSLNVCIGAETMSGAILTPSDQQLHHNVAIGWGALNAATGNHNVALGTLAARNMTGNHNIAIGYHAMWGVYDTAWETNFSGSNNVSIGINSGQLCRNGSNNTFLGVNADIDASGNTFNNSTAIGFNAKITASNQIVLGTAYEQVSIPGSLRMNDKQIYLRNAGDNNHYLTFSGTVDGPILCGSAGGALATAVNNALTWNNSNVTVNRQLVLNAGISATASQTINFGTNAVTAGSLNLNIGTKNISIGANALTSITTGVENIAIGESALKLSNGQWNVAIGVSALKSGANCENNTTIGNYSGSAITTGNQNTAIGSSSLSGATNITGDFNSAIGYGSGSNNASGSSNTYLGYNAGVTGGPFSNSTALGYNAKITAPNQIVLGTATETVKILGPTIMAGCNMANCTVTASGDASYKLVSTGYTAVPGASFSIYMNTVGQFAIKNATNTLVYLNYTSTAWITGSDVRLKKDIVTIDNGLHVITRLRPVSYRLKTDSDTYTPRLGFIAQEVQQVLPSIVSTGASIDEETGEHHLGIATTDIIPHMVKAMSELNDMCKAHKSEIAELKYQNEARKSEIAELKLLVQSLINK